MLGFVPEPDSGRGTVGILWNCFFTIFLCTWSAIHLDVPKHADKLYLLRNKMGWLCLGVVAPEVIALRAIVEWLRTREVLRNMRKGGWENATMLEAWYLSMGGIRIRTSHGDILRIRNIVKAVPELPGQFPSRQQIIDKSKSDFLAKFLTCLQMLWFFVQSIARLSQGLSISLLEVSTISYICLALISFGFWMTKPFNINTPTVIDSISPTKHLHRNTFDPRSGGLIVLLAWVSIVGCFAGIHSAAWFYQFPSFAETWIWRVSALSCFIVSLPVCHLAWAEKESNTLICIVVVSYTLVRLCLIVETFAAFRSCPASIYAELQWSRYWGHFG